MPPLGKIGAVGSAQVRPTVGKIEIGAYEHGAVPPSALSLKALSGQWLSSAFGAKTGTFTATVDGTPSATNLDAAVALAPGSATWWTGLAAIGRFNDKGTIDARSGSAYTAAASIPYAAGVTYTIRLVVDVAKKRYSVYVKPAGGAENLLGSGYSFRTEQAGASSLGSWIVTQQAASGSLSACNFSIQ